MRKLLRYGDRDKADVLAVFGFEDIKNFKMTGNFTSFKEYPSGNRIRAIPSVYPFARFSFEDLKDLDLLVEPCRCRDEMDKFLVQGNREGHVPHMLRGLCDAIHDEVSDMYGTTLIISHVPGIPRGVNSDDDI